MIGREAMPGMERRRGTTDEYGIGHESLEVRGGPQDSIEGRIVRHVRTISDLITPS